MQEADVFGRTLTFDANTANIDGALPTVIFIHGSGGDREDWKSQVDGMGGAVQLVALDLPGHGASSPPGESAVPAYEHWVNGFVQALGLEKVVLVGCSLGSAIALWAALESRPWLVGIGLVGSGGRLKVHPVILEACLNDLEQASTVIADYALSESADDEIRATVKAKVFNNPPGLVHGDLSACNDFDVMERLDSISIPTWILTGQEDRLTPLKYAGFLQQAISNSVLEVIPQAGHLANVEKPQEFNKSLVGFLSDLKL
jgi:pimeloyl-ACP methyl ester carboxylesterase